jgi:outer membrane lipoprotein SlyB
MEEQAKTRIHPLVAGAAVAVIVAAGVAVAAITGYLPGSNAEMAPSEKTGTPPASHPAQQRQHAAAAKPAETRQHMAAVCHDCGTIVEVKEIDVLGKGSGIGAVAGGVGGAVLGHEIGDGSRAGTAVGAVVGAVAGHQIERKAREHKKYEISVRMNDGSTKAITDESGNPVSWKSGDKVRVGADGAIRPI